MTELNHKDIATDEDRRYGIDTWARLFKASTWEEIKMVAKENPSLNSTAEAIFMSTADQSIHEQYRIREDNISHEKYQNELILALSNEKKFLSDENKSLSDENAVSERFLRKTALRNRITDKKRWSKAKTLFERLVIPDKLKGYVHDYEMNLFEIAYLEDDQVAKFKSDFRFVADYFVQMRKTGVYIPPDEKIVHVQELLSLMTALTNNEKFVESYDVMKGKERVSMRTFLDEAEERGIAIGIKRGKTEGREEGREEGITIAKNEDIKSLAEYFVEQTPSMDYEDAVKMAEKILCDR